MPSNDVEIAEEPLGVDDDLVTKSAVPIPLATPVEADVSDEDIALPVNSDGESKKKKRICVFCKEVVKRNAIKCKHCHAMIMLTCHECGDLTPVEDGYAETKNVVVATNAAFSTTGASSFGRVTETQTVLVCAACRRRKEKLKKLMAEEDDRIMARLLLCGVIFAGIGIIGFVILMIVSAVHRG